MRVVSPDVAAPCATARPRPPPRRPPQYALVRSSRPGESLRSAPVACSPGDPVPPLLRLVRVDQHEVGDSSVIAAAHHAEHGQRLPRVLRQVSVTLLGGAQAPDEARASKKRSDAVTRTNAMPLADATSSSAACGRFSHPRALSERMIQAPATRGVDGGRGAAPATSLRALHPCRPRPWSLLSSRDTTPQLRCSLCGCAIRGCGGAARPPGRGRRDLRASWPRGRRRFGPSSRRRDRGGAGFGGYSVNTTAAVRLRRHRVVGSGGDWPCTRSSTGRSSPSAI